MKVVKRRTDDVQPNLKSISKRNRTIHGPDATMCYIECVTLMAFAKSVPLGPFCNVLGGATVFCKNVYPFFG
jgi:hypothetical protein